MVAAAIQTIFVQPTNATVRAQLATIAAMLGRQFPPVGQMLIDYADDITAFADFPHQHWKKNQDDLRRPTGLAERLGRTDQVDVGERLREVTQLACGVPKRE